MIDWTARQHLCSHFRSVVRGRTHVTILNQVQVLAHASDGSRPEVVAIHQAEAEHESGGADQTPVKSMDDPFLLFRTVFLVIVDEVVFML